MRWFIAFCPRACVVDLDQLLQTAKGVFRVHVAKNGRDYDYAIGYFEPEQDDVVVGMFALPMGKVCALSEARYRDLLVMMQEL